MTSRLQDFVMPLGQLSDLLRARSLVFQRSSDPKRFAALLDWDTFRRVVESSLPPDKLCVTRNGDVVLPTLYLQHGKLNVQNLARLLDHGASLIAVSIEPYLPQVEALCADVGRHVGERTYAGALATTGRGGALKLHYDAQDILVMQIDGCKHWKIYDRPLAWPVNGMVRPEPPQHELAFDDTLRPGDFLFLPAGHWHHCESESERSLHLTILIEPPTGWHAVKALQRQFLTEEMFRMPLTRFHSPAERAAHEAALKKRLIEMVEQMSLSGFISESKEN